MANINSIKTALNHVITLINAQTEKADTNVTDAVNNLISVKNHHKDFRIISVEFIRLHTETPIFISDSVTVGNHVTCVMAELQTLED